MRQIKERLQKRELHGNLRTLPITRCGVDFASNDYLGLASSMHFSEMVIEELQFGQAGATGSRLLTGNSEYTQRLEEQIALFHGYEAALLFNCGYMANIGLLSVIAGEEDTILCDAHVHASTREGIRLSRAKSFSFRHNDLEHLEKRLKGHSKGECYVCIESLYSTDGSCAPLVEISRLAKRYGSYLIVDEAHAVGVYGPLGRGLVADSNLTSDVAAQVVTFGKALGAHGAVVLGSETLIQALINFSPSFIYTTALPFHVLALIRQSYAIFPTLDYERHHLLQLAGKKTHIQSVRIPGNQAVKAAAKKLQAKGFLVNPLMSPTVRRGEECLKICLHAYNTVAQWNALQEELLNV